MKYGLIAFVTVIVLGTFSSEAWAIGGRRAGCASCSGGSCYVPVTLGTAAKVDLNTVPTGAAPAATAATACGTSQRRGLFPRLRARRCG